MRFEDLGLAEPLLRAVVAEGYTAATPIQSQAIPHVMQGRDLLGCAQTGTGKTAAFALPILDRLMRGGRAAKNRPRKIRVLILAPTRELASQIDESFEAYGRHTDLRHTVVYGGVGQRPQTRALERGVDILVATPGRLLDLMNQGYIDLSSIEIFVLDEADRMLDMGFLPDVRRIIARLPERRQTLLFSATMPDDIQRLADAILDQPVEVRVAPVKATTDLIEQSVYFISQQLKAQLLTKFLSTESFTRALVFTRTKHGADRVAKQLNRSGIRADAIHGNKSQTARQRTLADFKSNRTPVLVATDIAARGIDVEGISHVLNFDLPHEPETYVHRIGRTGRAGATGVAISFCDRAERKHLKAIEGLIRQALTVEESPVADASAAPADRERETPRKPEARAGFRTKQSKPRRSTAKQAASHEEPRKPAVQSHGNLPAKRFGKPKRRVFAKSRW